MKNLKLEKTKLDHEREARAFIRELKKIQREARKAKANQWLKENEEYFEDGVDAVEELDLLYKQTFWEDF